MNDENLTADINKAIERDLRVPPRTGNGAVVKNDATHRERIDMLIAEVQMTLRILEEAKKRL